ncbi:hypothetical protein GJV76_07735 [Myroides sp. BIT-d1]|uniref:DUF4374 domain-containing protein n=1 Tax=Myroides albus TaxID=2562892 RepID=A0A6I3LPG3_9FLAO|nr:hypothetical protein [Myroides albus]MTG98022.1 hypothetical protein [Myroides albus]
MKLNIYKSISLLCLFFVLGSCSKEPSSAGGYQGEEDYNYFLLSALGSWPNTVHYMTATNDLTQGQMDLKKEGDEINTKGTYSYIVKNGYIYNYKNDQGILKKFKYTNDRLVTIKEIPYTYISEISSFVWIDSKTLLIAGTTGNAGEIRYTIINAEDLSIIKQDAFKGLTPFPDEYNHYMVGAITYFDNTLYMQYGFRDDKWLIPDYYNFATIDYSDFTVKDTRVDNRSTGVSNASPYFHTTFTTENNQFYYPCFPRVQSDDEDIYLFRVNQGETSYDADYSFNLTKLVKGKKVETILQYLGNNKMMVLYRDKELGNSYNGRYILADLETQQIVREFKELPSDEPYEWGTFVQNDKLYFAINSKDNNNYVWIYDSKTDKVTQGMSIPTNISGYARFDKFYD